MGKYISKLVLAVYLFTFLCMPVAFADNNHDMQTHGEMAFCEQCESSHVTPLLKQSSNQQQQFSKLFKEVVKIETCHIVGQKIECFSKQIKTLPPILRIISSGISKRE